MNTVFNGASLTNTKFDDAYLEGADFSNASGVSGTSLINAGVTAESGVWKYTEQDGTPYTLEYGPTKLGGLATQGGVRCPNGQEGPCCPGGDLKACLGAKLKPQRSGPFPPIPPCVHPAHPALRPGAQVLLRELPRPAELQPHAAVLLGRSRVKRRGSRVPSSRRPRMGSVSLTRDPRPATRDVLQPARLARAHALRPLPATKTVAVHPTLA